MYQMSSTIVVSLVSILLTVVAVSWVSTLILRIFNKNSLAEFANKNDSKLWLIQLINRIYKLKSLFTVEQNVCAIESIIVYPIKSIGKGLKVKEWPIGEFGLLYDRQYVFASYKEDKKQWIPITLREFDALIKVEYEIEDNEFIVKYDRRKFFKLPLKMPESYLDSNSQGLETIQLWNVPVQAHDVSKVFPKDFITKFGLPGNTRLFYTEEGHPVKTLAPKNLPNTVNGSQYRNATFQDYYPLLILSEIDLANLNKKLAANGFKHFQVTDYTFRPNIIVKGELAPHDEDSWYKFRIVSNGVKHYFTTTTKCGRCMVPNIDYNKGPTMDKSAPVSKTLSQYRRVDIGNKFLTYFGVYAVRHETHYTIRSGDTFDILQRRVNIFESGR